MSIFMLKATRDAIGADAGKCESRSLFMDRFADPQAKEDARKEWFTSPSLPWEVFFWTPR